MLNWTAIRQAVLLWSATGSGVPTYVENERRAFNEPRRLVVQFRRIEAASQYDVSIGERTVQTAPGPPPVLSQVPVARVRGQLVLTCEIRSESLSQGADEFGPVALERLRALAELDRLRAILATAGVALARFGPSEEFDEEVDERLLSAWIAEIQFNVSFDYLADLDDAVLLIETVNGAYKIPSDSADEAWSAPE